MRLRVTLQRHGLPDTNFVWNVADTNSAQAYTIARLLDDLNLVLPLEAEQWGLEDYVVEVGGFECLHFAPVAGTLKEDDHINIRPLLTPEVRARTLSGRYQISDGGQHLVDGIPFGRPYLRKPNRPAISIPSPKRRRLLHDATESAEDNEVAGLIVASGDEIARHYSRAPRSSREKRKMKAHVHFDASNESSDDEDDDDNFEPEDEGSDLETSSKDSSGDDDSSGDTEDSGDDSSDTSDASDTSSSGSDSDDSSSDSDGSDTVDRAKDKPTRPVQQNPPGTGFNHTKKRNVRRREAKTLKNLKDAGVLPETATLKDMREYEQAKSSDQAGHSREAFTSVSLGKRKRFDTESSATVEPSEEATELERRRQELMKHLADNTSSERQSNQGPLLQPTDEDAVEETSLKQSQPEAERRKRDLLSQKPEVASSEPSPKRLRPDVSAFKRMLAHQTTPFKKPLLRGKQPPAPDGPPEPEGASEPGFWKSRINLSAFECWEEDYELSKPPFPFEQHWDPASKAMREKRNKKKKNNNKKQWGAQQDAEHGQLPDEEEETIVLDYDEAPVEGQAEPDTSTAIESQILQDVEVVAKLELPPLPDDVDSLPALEPEDFRVGAIIAFKRFDINPATFSPEISAYKTARIEQDGDSGNGAGAVKLQLADRDVQKKQQRFDKKGNAIHTPADSIQLEDEEGAWDCTFNDLIEAKLVQAA